jgi:hypothetical protein
MSDRLEQLRADARYRRDRLDLYRAKAYGPRPTSPARLAELERDYQFAAERLERASRAGKRPAPPNRAQGARHA